MAQDFNIAVGADFSDFVSGVRQVRGQVQETATQIGKDLGDGVDKGLESGTRRAADAGAKIGKELLSGASSGLSGISTAAGQAFSGVTGQATSTGAQVGRALAGQIGPDVAAAMRSGLQSAVQEAQAAAKAIGLVFNQSQFRFESASGSVVPEGALDAMGQLNNRFAAARAGMAQFVPVAQETKKSLGEIAGESTVLQGAIGGLAFALSNALVAGFERSIAAIGSLITQYGELDTEIRRSAAIAGEVGGYDKLNAVITEVGIAASGSILDVAQLARVITATGFSVEQTATALPGIVRGAEATGTAYEQMGTTVGNVLRAFQINVSETSRVVDVLVQTSNRSGASILDLQYAFSYAAPVAKALNITLEDTAATIGLMTKAGIQSSVAGTGLQTGLIRLQKAASGASGEALGLARGQEKMTAGMQALGASVVKANGELLPMDQTLLNLKKSLAEFSLADRIELTSALFGEAGGSKFLGVLNQSTNDIRKMFSDIRNSAGSTDKAREEMQGFRLNLQQLQETLNTIAVGGGAVVASALNPLITVLNQLFGAVLAIPAPVRNVAAALILLSTGAVAARVAWAVLSAAMRTELYVTAAAEITKLALIVRGDFAGGLGVATRALGPFITAIKELRVAEAAGLATSAIGTRMAGVTQAISGLASKAGQVLPNAIGALIPQLERWGAHLNSTSVYSKVLEGNATGLGKVLQGGVTIGAEKASAALAGLSGWMSSVGVAGLVTGLGVLAAALLAAGAAVLVWRDMNKDAWAMAEENREVLNSLADSADESKTVMGETWEQSTALGRALADASKPLTDFNNGLKEIPGIGPAVAAAIEAVWNVMKNSPVGLAVQGIIKLVEAWQLLHQENQNAATQSEAADQMIKLDAAAVKASNTAVRLQAALKRQPGMLTDGMKEVLERQGEETQKAIRASEKLAETFRKQADAARKAGQTDLAATLDKEAESAEKTTKLLETTQLGLEKEAAKHSQAALAASKHGKTLGQLSTEYDRLQKALDSVGHDKEADDLRLVADRSITAEEAARRKSAQTVEGLKQEIAVLDLAIKQGAKGEEEKKELDKLKAQRSKANLDLAKAEMAQQEANVAVTRKQIEVQKQLAAASQEVADAQSRRSGAQLDQQASIGRAMVSYSQAALGLTESRYGLAIAEGKYKIDNAKALGLSEGEVGRLKREQQELERKALVDRFRSTLQILQLEAKMFELAQRKAQIEAKQALNTATAKSFAANQDVRVAEAGGDPTAIAAANAKAQVAQLELQTARENLALLAQTQGIERQIQELTRQTTVNKLLQQGASAGISSELRAMVPATLRGSQAAGSMAGAFAMVATSAQTTAAASNSIQRFLSGRDGSGSGLKEGMEGAKDSADGIKQADLEGSMGNAATAAAAYRQELEGAAVAAEAGVRAINSLSSAPAARWAGGPVSAGGDYQVNELGQESFLSNGSLSLIDRPAYATWTAPGSGVVIPAGVTASLKERGAFGGAGGAGGGLPVASIGRAGADQSISQLASEVNRLSGEVRALTMKDWNMRVGIQNHSGGRAYVHTMTSLM
jgi:TP901 family phage tail tape measure protein